MKALDKVPFLQGIIECLVEIIHDYIAPWVLESGGWVSIYIVLHFYHKLYTCFGITIIEFSGVSH